MLEACFTGNGTAKRKSSLSLRLISPTAQHRRRTQHRRRQLLLQQLEPRQLMAADAMPSYQMPSSYHAGYGFAPTTAPPPTTLSYNLPSSTAPASSGPSQSPAAPSSIDYQSSPLGNPYSTPNYGSATTSTAATIQPPASTPLSGNSSTGYGSNTYDVSTYSYQPEPDLSGNVARESEPTPTSTVPAAVVVNAANELPDNEPEFVPVTLNEASFFSVAQDFWLPEMAWWPTSPISYEPTLTVLPSLPANLQVEEFPQPITSVQATPVAARTAYDNAVATAEAAYKQAVAAAEAAHTANLAAAGANHSSAIALAALTRQAAIDGFTPQTLVALEQAVKAADEALQAEIDRVKQQATAQLTASQNTSLSARNERDQVAENEHRNASDAARSASMNTTMAIEQRRMEAQDRLYNRQINQAQFDALSAALNAEKQAEERRLAEELSGYRQIYDNAMIDHEAVALTENAASQQLADVQIAEAGRAQQATLAQAKQNLALAQNANRYREQRTAAAANIQYQRDVAAAAETYAHAKADADAGKAFEIKRAATARSKSLATASATLSIAIANAAVSSITASSSGDASAAAAYRVAAARAQRDLQVQQAEASRDQQHAIVDADLALEMAILTAGAERSKQDASASKVRENSFADAASRFRADYFDMLQQHADEASGDHIDAEQDRDAARREFDGEMAAVQQTRSSRGANELKPNRQALALVQNKRNHGLISQETYLTETESLAREAKQLQLAIVQDTFGSPGSSRSPASSAAGTESSARETWLAKNNRAISELNQQQRARAAEASRVTAELSEAHDHDVAEAQQAYKATIADASLTASSAAQSALQDWVQSASRIHAEYQSAFAGAAAAHAVALSGATADFYTTVSRDRAETVATFATGNDNPWASREAAAAAADAARIASVATAYNTLVDTTAGASATAISEAAAARATLIAETTVAQIAANATIQAAIATYTTTLAGAEQTRDTDLSSAVSSYDTTIATEHQAWRDIKEGAEFDRSAGYFGALLLSIFESIAVNPLVSAIEASRRALEVSIGTSYASTVAGAHQDYLITLAGENKDLHDAIAALRESYEIASADAVENLQRTQADASQTAASQIAAAQSAFATSLAGIGSSHDTSVLDAGRNFTVAVADADRAYAIALTTADVTFDVAIAQRKRDAVDDWASTQCDASGFLSPQAQYSIAVYDAALAWQRAAAPQIQEYRNAIANQSHQLTVATADAILRADRGRVVADEAFTIAVADAESTLGRDTALAHQQLIATAANIDASLARASSNLAKTFADAFAAGRQQWQEGYANQSAASELSLVGHRSQLHTKQISPQDYQARREETNRSLMLALSGLDRDFAIERADAAENWGHSSADDHHNALTRHVEAAATAWQSTVDAYQSAGLEIARASESYRVETAQLDAAMTIAIVRAEAAFDHDVAVNWATLVENIGRLDVDYARAVATADVAHHIAVAEHAAQKLIDQFGPRRDRSQQFAIRVANARTDFFRNAAEDYISAIAATARQSAEVDGRTANAGADLQADRGTAVVAFVTATQNALADSIAEVAGASTQYATAVLSDLSAWVRATAGADQAQQTTMAEAYRTAGRDYATAEAAAYRSAAEQVYSFAQINNDRTSPPGSFAGSTSAGSYLDQYNRAFATLHFNIDSTMATAGGAYGSEIASAQREQVSRLADAKHAAVGAGSAAQHRLDLKVNDALRDLRNANADADKTYGRSIAKINRDYVVANAETVRDTLLAQYRAARDLYASFSGLTDLNVRYAVAQVRGAYAYAQALLPQYASTQTTIADANLSYAQTVIDAHREHRQNLTDAAHRYGSGIADAQQSDTDNRSSLWRTAVNAHAAALATSKTAIAAAGATLGHTKATLRRDAAIAAGWGKPHRIDTQAVATAQQAYERAMADATGARDNAVASARDAYFRGLAAASRNTERDAAERDHAFSVAAIDSFAELRAAEINAEFTAAGIETDALHDYRIADIDAVIVGLTAVRDDFNTTATSQARLVAVTSRDQRVAAIDAERTVAQARIASTQSSQLSKVADEKTDALTEENAARAQRRDSAQRLYTDETAPHRLAHLKLPYITNNTAVSLGVIARPVAFMEAPLTLVDTLTAQFTFGASGASMIGSGVADELYVYTGAASAVDMAKYLIRAEVNSQANRIRHLPYGEELVQYTGILWSLTRQQAALNAQGLMSWGQSISAWSAGVGAANDAQWYGFGVLGSKLAEGVFGFVAGVFFDPASTAQSLAGVADAHYRAGGTLAVVGAFTGGLSIYESATGIDFLTGQTLSGADRFDRGMLGTSSLLTQVGAAGVATAIKWKALKRISSLGGAELKHSPTDLHILNNKFTPNFETRNKVTAYEFYTGVGGFSPSRAFQHMDGIDFTQPVVQVTIPPGIVAQQFVGPRGTGNYFAPIGSSPLQSGIPNLGQYPTLFQSLGDMPALQSFTRPDFIYPPGAVVPGSGAGGGIQYFVPNNRFFIAITR